jgi:hypothetical protein
VILAKKTYIWHIFCNDFYFALITAIILGGRPKSVSEEDVSARFFNYKIGQPILLATLYHIRSRSGGGTTPEFLCKKASLSGKKESISSLFRE